MPKSKLGCKTCRRRKIKCDEEFPTCQQCRTAARQCDGPFKQKFVFTGPRKRHESKILPKQNDSLPPQCSVVPFFGPSEARTFQYFLAKAAPDLGGDLDSEFWTVLLPKISHGDRAIRNALLAISQLYEQTPSPIDQAVAQEIKTNTVSRWYIRSLSDFGSRMSTLKSREDYQLALLSCILFTNIEFQQNNVLNACNLLKCGLSLISSTCRAEHKALNMSDGITKTLVQMFTRQRVLLAMYGHPTSHSLFEDLVEAPFDDISPLESFKEARERLFDCLNDLVLLMRAARSDMAEQEESQCNNILLGNQRFLARKLKRWHRDFVRPWTIEQANFTSRNKSTTQIMTIYCELALIFVYTYLQPEMSLDQHMGRFGRILDLAEQFIKQRHENGFFSVKYSPELGVIAPLFLVGWKCREPGLRRRALRLLHQGPEQEALYSARIHAKALKAVIDIEESLVPDSSGHGMRQKSWLPCEEARVRNLTVHYETWAGSKVQPALVYRQMYFPEGGTPTYVERTMLL
ncbi:MAG: hypothetical protein Q9160_008005 [Pyrenula sp. 1 TL-2023]